MAEEEKKPDVDLTEEGTKPRHFFPAYPRGPHSTNTMRLVGFAGTLLAIVLLYVTVYALMHAPPPPPPPAPAEWMAPVAMLEIVDLSEAVLTGLASGRTGAAVFENEALNHVLMMKYGTNCATPWLAYAWSADPGVVPAPLPAAGRITGANVLTILGMRKALINARVVSHSNETTMVMAPFKFRSGRNSRVISTSVTLQHHDGLFSTTDLDTAFCVQELYE